MVAPAGLEDMEGAHQVGINKRRRIDQRVVVVGLGSKVNDQVSFLHEGVHQVAVGQVTDHQLHPIQPRNRVRVTGIAQLIQHRHGSIRVILHSRVDKVSANETGSAGN